MLVRESELYLYHLTLRRQSNYIHSCIGHFIDDRDSATTKVTKSPRKVRNLQLCLATETHLELYDVSEGSLRKLGEIGIFATLTCVKSFRIENYGRSFLAITSDSGNLSICRFAWGPKNDRAEDCLVLRTLLNEPLARSGVRRLSPISQIAVDLHGRCLFLSAIEKNKLCFVLNGTSDDDSLKIQSPLEVSRPNMLTLDTTACDVQFDNPCFASIELDTSQNNSAHLIFYILDLGLNNVIKKADYKISDSANFIMGLPSLSKYGISSKSTNSGEPAHDSDEMNPFVLVGFENYITVQDMNGLYTLKVNIPKRRDQTNLISSITSSALQILKNDFFVLLQSNFGDLFKVSIYPNSLDGNRPIASISFFDTIPQAESLHIFRNGYLFSNSEYGDNYLLQFESLGDDGQNSGLTVTSADGDKTLNYERPETLSNLSVVEKITVLNPLLTGKVTDSCPLVININANDVARSLVNGIIFQEKTSSMLPPNAMNIWTIRLAKGEFHRLLFISFPKSTMILKIEEGTIEELSLKSNPFKLKNDRTIFVGSIGEKSVIQVCENEARQVISSKDNVGFRCKLEWFPPAGIRIVAATCTQTQLAIGLSNGEVVYFEMDQQSSEDTLHELQKRIGVEEYISSLSMLPGLRSELLAVGSTESIVKIFSMKGEDPDTFLEVVAIQTLVSPVHDLKLVNLEGEIQLHVGLQNGLYSRSKIDPLDGQIYDVRTKLLGLKPVSISLLNSTDLGLVSLEEDQDEDEEDEKDEDENEELETEALKKKSTKPCLILHSSKTWSSYTIDSLTYVRPLVARNNESNFVSVTEFRAENMKSNGCCALTSTGALSIGKLADFVTNQKWLSVHEIEKPYIIDEDEDASAEHESEEEDENFTIKPRLYRTHEMLEIDAGKGQYMYIENSNTNNHVRIKILEKGALLNVHNSNETSKIIKGVKSTAASIVKFSKGNKHFVMASGGGNLHTYEIQVRSGGNKKRGTFDLKLLHITAVEDRVHSMIPFLDKLLVPVYGNLILYSLGQKQLLKNSISSTTSSITKVTAIANWKNDRIAVGDNRESVTLFLFNKEKELFTPVADDIVKRYVTVLEFLDKSTVVGGDKFGNIWTLRLPAEYEQKLSLNFPHALNRLQELPALKNKAPNIMECAFKLTLTNHFYVNDIPTQIQICESIQVSDRPGIVYFGLQGTIGCLSPLVSKSEVRNLKNIEHLMSGADDKFFLQQENRFTNMVDIDETGTTEASRAKKYNMPEGAYSIVGRDHSKYRGYYAPARNVIDGDLCESFLNLSTSEQEFLCKDTQQEVPGILKHINEIRTNYM